MSVLLQDTKLGLHQLGVNDDGTLTTYTSTGAPAQLVLNDANGQAWRITVDTNGLLSTVLQGDVLSTLPTYVVLTAPGGVQWALSVQTSGLLQDDVFTNTAPWSPVGFGAGTDNAIDGGGGGYMAYPQPSVFRPTTTPEEYMQCGPINISFGAPKGNIFTISNPGRV